MANLPSISPVIVVWSMTTAVAMVFGVIHFLVWLQDRKACSNLAFAVMASAASIMAMIELALMHTTEPQAFGNLIQWAHLPGACMTIAVIAYLHTRFGTGRAWLAMLAVGLRVLVVAVNFLSEPNLNYQEISALQTIWFFGSEVNVVGSATPGSGLWLANLALLAMLVYLADTIFSLGRRGDASLRGQARVIVFCLLLWVAIGAGSTMLIHHGVVRLPYLITLPAMPLMVAIAWELSREILKCSALTVALREQSEKTLIERKEADTLAARHREELAHLSRVGTLGELSASIAHELNQPLSIILSNAETAHRVLELHPERTKEAVEILGDVIAATHRAKSVIQRLRAMLERGPSESSPLPLDEVVSEVVAMLCPDFKNDGITVDFQPGAPPPVTGDRIQLQQVFLNLLLNARDAILSQPGSQRVIRVFTGTRDEVRAMATVEDDGIGLPPEKERIFETFFTTKPRGLGMGLAICRSIMEGHGGTLAALDRDSGGTRITLELPFSRTVIPP